MLGDLAARLSRLGIRVSVGHRGRLALAAAHAGKAVVVETDEAFAGLSLRESLRLRPDVLRRLGWHYLRVHSFELFGNPDAVATRVAALLGKPETPTSGCRGRLMSEEPAARRTRRRQGAPRAAHARARVGPVARAAGPGGAGTRGAPEAHAAEPRRRSHHAGATAALVSATLLGVLAADGRAAAGVPAPLRSASRSRISERS